MVRNRWIKGIRMGIVQILVLLAGWYAYGQMTTPKIPVWYAGEGTRENPYIDSQRGQYLCGLLFRADG